VAKAAGASVVAVAGGREKCALVRELGADAVVDYREVESLSAAVREATAGRGSTSSSIRSVGLMHENNCAASRGAADIW
jgi:NADPH:quinone reductase-like Zn-dependent oxidoreductase